MDNKMICPYCGKTLEKIINEDNTEKYYYECFECGYCSDEYKTKEI